MRRVGSLSKQFRIPAIPPSVNNMYKLNFRTKSVYLDDSVCKFKSVAIPHIPPLRFKEGSRLNVEVEYHGQFLNKGDGETKRRDGQNLDKCLYDVIFEKLGIDDKFAWQGSWKKIHNPDEEFTLVTITELE
jgi:hypothetical protein